MSESITRIDLSYAQGQMDKYGNVIPEFPHQVRIGFITEPAEGLHLKDRALGLMVVVAESDEQEFLKRADEFGLGDIRCEFPEVHFYLAAAE